MTKNTKSKSMGWLKGVISSNQNLTDESNQEKQASREEVKELQREPEPANYPENNSLLSKDSQDKVALDMIISLENLLKDRQLTLFKNKGLEDQLFTAKEMINRLKHENMKTEQHLYEKNKEISLLEDKLSNKQMSYDQLLEDYKDYQNNSNKELEKITTQLEKEIQKYNKLNDESTNTQYQNLLHIKELEERIRELEVENQKYIEQYQKILAEKTQLMQTINDFTERMSFSFSPKTTESTTQAE